MKKFTKFIAALALLLFMTPAMVGWGQTRDDVVYKTALFGSSYNSQGVSSYTGNSWYSTTNGFRLDIVNANNNNNGWSYIKIGGKSGAYTGTLTTNAAIDEAVTKVDLTIDAITAANVTSMTLYTSSNGSTWTNAGTFDKSIGVKTVALSNPTAALYYKIEVVCTKGSSNGLVTISKVEYYHSNGGASVNTWDVTYHANGGTGDNIVVTYNEGDDVTIADNTFTKPGYAFTEWNTEEDGTGDSYAPGDVIEDIDDDIDLYAQWEVSTSTTGNIKFGSGDGHVRINAPTVTGDDDIDNEWTITTVGTTSFTQQATYSQVGSGSSPATSITFTTTLPEEVEITSMEVKFGGFSGTAGTITMKVGGQTIGTGSLNATNDVVVNSSSTAIGDVLTVTVTNIAKGVKCYYISYTYEEATPDPAVATTTTINVPSGFNTDIHNGTSAGTLTATVAAGGTAISGATVTWESSNTNVATIAANGAVTLVAVGTTTITASYAGVEGQYRPSSDTYELTVTDSYAPGTVNNPYTVAQARAAIDANTGITNVYATGIISQVDSYSNNTITYWISDDGTTTNQLEVYKGKNLNNTNFTALSDVEVGATVIVFGTLKKYNEIYEFNSGNYLTSYTAPQHAVEAPTFSPVAGTYAEAQTVTISCATEGADIYYTLDGSDPTMGSTMYENPITVSQTTTIKAVAYDGNDTPSNIATATYHINSQANPYTVAQALAFNEYPANGIYVHGIVSTAPTSLSNGTLTYYISDDGTTTTQLEVYKGKDLNNEAFTAADDIQVGDIVTVYGNVVIYGTTNPIKEFAQGNYLVSFERPTVPAQEYTLTVSNLSHVNLFVFGGEESETLISTEDGETIAQVYNGTEVTVSIEVEEGYVFQSLTITDANGDPVETEELEPNVYYGFTMPASNVTITATATVAPVVTTSTYTLATSIESGKQYIIVGQADGDYYAMGNDKGNNRYAYGITLNGTTATADIADTGVHEFTIGTITEGYYFIMDATTSGGYLYAAGSGSGKNYLKTESTLDENDNGKWAITFATDGTVAVIAQGTSTNNQMRFNNSNILFSCYSSGQHPVYLYVKDETGSYTKDIVGWNNSTNLNYYLIASPIGEVNPTNVTLTGEDIPTGMTNMVSGSYDLYYFDQAQPSEWQNYKDNDGTGGFNLVPGKGYLYANSETVTLTFTGNSINADTYDVTLTKAEATSGSGLDFPAWNLVGNPFATTAWLTDPQRSFYTLTTAGEYITPTSNSINSMEGIFVVAESDGETITFTTTQPSKKSQNLVLNLSNGQRLIDRAIVRFDGGDLLPKLQFRQGSTMVYIPMDGQDYAVVSCEEMGAMPVNFKAENNGTYTLSMNSENVGFAYLHLVDNMTGADVDLLQTPSYSFEARTTDIESRFKLVYATGDNSQEDNFAFFSNGSFVINNEGNATLQVIDVTGRMISSETINGCANVNVNAAAGVYMLRLVNGDNVKVQKVVVK